MTTTAAQPARLAWTLSALLLACGPGETPQDAPGAQAAPDPAANRTGAWIDTLVAIEEPNADAAVTRLEAGDIDVYASSVSAPGTFRRIRESPGLTYKTSYGLYNELTFNPSPCADEGRLNPFSVPEIREAMNWLVDREHLVAEILGGLGTPRYVPIGAAAADRGRLAAEIRAIEAKYAHDPERARTVVTEQMRKLGATSKDGRWQWGGAPVELIGVIRTEDERTQIGDYVANQLEDLGFAVVRDYKTSAEATPIVLRGEPTECGFHYYTGGWVSTRINRDSSGSFSFFYTPAGLPRPLWQAYEPTEAFAELAQRLRDSDFGSLDERAAMFADALPMAMANSVRIWLLDRTTIAPHRAEIQLSADLSGSIVGSSLWPYTLRRSGRVGGSLTWASASILTDAWNPVAGTNWVFDQALIGATGQASYVPDPNTGLFWPHRVERFQVTAKQGLPISRTLDWVQLDFAPEIAVPEDAWIEWDAQAQRFRTVAEAADAQRTALLKTVATYPADLYDRIRWHDGSRLSAADMLLPIVLFFDQATPESPVYDEGQVPLFQSFVPTFRGLRVTSTEPLVVEFYSDNWSLDAESAIALGAPWPAYGRGEAPWHTVALGILAEQKGEAVFSGDKATAREVEQLNYIAGPTLEVLSNQLTAAAADGFVPYAPTLAGFVAPEEAATRYANARAWQNERGHFWVGTGPFYLDRAFPVEGTVVLVRNADYPDRADRWTRFAEPAIPEIDVDGPTRVQPGQAATFDVEISFAGEPYATADVQEVRYLVFDATGALAARGEAQAVGDGSWQVPLTGDVTNRLEVGANRLEVIAVSRLVALPSLGSGSFVTAP